MRWIDLDGQGRRRFNFDDGRKSDVTPIRFVCACKKGHLQDIDWRWVVHGEAASEIVRVAEERKVDLIVIASHGRTGLGRILFGSTAESVVRHAPCPVLVVKPPQQEQSEQ